jgi:RNA polymerase II-associated protein 2
MASNSKVLRGILKKHPANNPSLSQNDEAREIAIAHAKIIQNRKDIEAEILNQVIKLSEYPTSRGTVHSASNPVPSDVKDFKEGVRLFQPTDYDDLIEERNINGLCGYALCGQPRKRFAGGGEWKLSNAGIVKKKDLEKWCSQDCARRALYVKVQLLETAAWERAGIPEIQIDLFGEDTANDQAAQVTANLANLKLQEERRNLTETSALARERGDDPSAPSMKIVIREKDVDSAIEPSPLAAVNPDDDDSHRIMEGYKVKFGQGADKVAESPD